METTESSPDVSGTTGRQRPVTLWLVQAVLALVAAGAAYGSLGLGIWTSRGPGAGFFPLVLGVGILVLTLVWFLQSLRDADAAGAAPAEMDLRHVVITLVSLVVLALLLDVIGFVAAMFLFLLYHLRVRGRIGWVKALVIALVGSLGSFLLFNNFLQVSLPVGSIPPFTWMGI